MPYNLLIKKMNFFLLLKKRKYVRETVKEHRHHKSKKTLKAK